MHPMVLVVVEQVSGNSTQQAAAGLDLVCPIQLVVAEQVLVPNQEFVVEVLGLLCPTQQPAAEQAFVDPILLVVAERPTH